ncbi:MAG: DUF2087 domain-containing protein [Velocimicrobium sp.]
MKKTITVWEESIEAIVNGYKETKEFFICVLCGETFEKGRVYDLDGILYDALGAVKGHIKEQHGCSVDYLLDQNLNLTGITQIQQKILKLMSKGFDDKSIAKEVGIANSTVRNHRYKLREKEKQAKLFLSVMESLEQKTNLPILQMDDAILEELHTTATMIDDRYNITDKEREKAIKTYMDENGAIKQFPAKEKKKIILLREIIKQFHSDREYQEKEVDKILERIYNDYATLRRALIEYGFLDRSDDCKIYRVKE